MSLNNGIKIDEFIYQHELADGRVITIVGERHQTAMKKQVMLVNALTTAGGEVLDVDPIDVVADTFDNQRGIRKEFYMGYSICLPDDTYDIEVAKYYARKRFSRPLVTYNFTYLNDDMIQTLMVNEAEYIANHLDKYTNGQVDAVKSVPSKEPCTTQSPLGMCTPNDLRGSVDTSNTNVSNHPNVTRKVNGVDVSEDDFQKALADLMSNPFVQLLMSKFEKSFGGL